LSTYFVDTSALAKRYINEVGTQWVRSWTSASAGNVVVIAELTALEMFSVFARREVDKEITSASANRLRSTFLAHLNDEYLTIKVDSPLWLQARDLITKHAALRLCTLDAVQLACALDAKKNLPQAVTFVRADPKLLSAATAEGFTVDDPMQHP
jgi:predicted nucleic acid-binding protein